MAGTNFASNFSSVALVASTAKSVIALTTPANVNVNLKQIHVGFNGTSGTQEAILIELVRFGSDGTGTSGTSVKLDNSAVSIQSTFKHSYTVEPTSETVLMRWKIHPQSQFVVNLDLLLPNSTITALRLTSANGMNTTGCLVCEE